MSIINIKSTRSSTRDTNQDQSTTIVIGCFISIITVLIGLHLGRVLTYAYPFLSFLTALYLYQKSGLKYISFCWWIIFLSPEIRRIADFYSSWTNPSPILLSPYLVSCVSIMTIVKYLPKIQRGNGTPFFLCLASIMYGFTIGVLDNSFQESVLGCLAWISPFSIGFYIFINYSDYPKYKDSILKVFLWGTLVMGVYGIIQYIYLPPWDAFWMNNTRNEVGFNTIGNPIPYEVRVFSTLNSPQPFASVIKAGLLIILYQFSPLSIVASGFGYLSFLLSSARSAWVSWLFTVIVLLIFSRKISQIRMMASLCILTVSMTFLTTLEPFSENIQNRFVSLQDLNSDESYSVRLYTLRASMDEAISKLVGDGFGAKDSFAGDHGFLTMLHSLGWVGSIPYLIGVAALFIVLLRHMQRVKDPFVGFSTAIALGTFQQMLSNLSVAGSSGAVMWTFLGLAIAGVQYEMRLSNIKKARLAIDNDLS